MRYVSRQLKALSALAALVAGLGVFGATRAQAQGTTDPRPQWMRDSTSTFNRYLTLWTYFRTDNITKFDIWTGPLGDPLNPNDDFTIFFNAMGDMYAVPWGTRLFSAPHPPYSVQNPDTEPYANMVTIRVDDPNPMMGAQPFLDLDYPNDGTAVFSPAVISLPEGQGFAAPYRFENGTLEVTQKLQFARDLVRIEYSVTNIGTTNRRVGIRLLVDPYVEYWAGFRSLLGIPTTTDPRSIFLPGTGERVTFEKDYGQRTGTNTTPRDPLVPEEYLAFDDDEGPNPQFIVKQILRGNGATPPTRVVFANSLNLYPNEGAWDYSVDRPQELRISDMSCLIYWDPIDVPAGQRRDFVTYAGLGVASHVMSNAYLTHQARVDIPEQQRNLTQGYIGAVQAPFALPLAGGAADASVATVTAYMQNQYIDSNLPNAFAFLELPEGLQFANNAPDQSQRLDLGSLSALRFNSTFDEGSGSWTLQANGIESGLLPLTVTFSNGFQDSARVVRNINVPQGRRFQLTEDWKMITFPFTYSGLQNDPAVALGLQAGTYQLLKYNPTTGSYDQVNQLQPGEGYWVRSIGLGTTFVDLQNAAAVDMDTRDSFVSTIRRGWNQVGNPSPYAVPVREIRFLQPGGQLISYEEAVTARLVGPAIYRYNRKTGQYEQLTLTQVVQPGEGIWLFSFGERNIVWPAPQGPQLSITP